METTDNKKSNKILYEIRDMLTGAAFPVMLQLIFSTSIILFADYNEEPVLQVFVLVFGEILLAGAYVVFGRQNGLAAYRRTVLGEKKRAGGTADKRALYKTGEYALWKGFVIGAVSCVPFVVFQFIQCVAPNIVCEFILKYAFGWAVYPFIVISEAPSVGNLSPWLNFIWVVIPVCIHALAYYMGARGEKKRQSKVEEAQKIKDKPKR